MELAKPLVDSALKALELEGESALPKDLRYLGFFVAKDDDHSIKAFGSIRFEGVVYKIGIKRTSHL